jgi:hypothetical protein
MTRAAAVAVLDLRDRQGCEGTAPTDGDPNEGRLLRVPLDALTLRKSKRGAVTK